MPTFVLLPSPLLPAAAYSDLAGALGRLGASARVAPVEAGPDLDPHELVEAWAALVEPGATLVAHSNSGYLAPAVRAAATTAGRHVGGVVFVDAALPPESGPAPLAPPRFREHLAGLADADGVLPPWTRWWPREALEEILPAGRLTELDRECPRLPVGYFHTELTPPRGWVGEPSAYLAFGTTYADELAAARGWGWPHREIPGGHLHLLVDPAAVAHEVVALREQLPG
ncbi:hypothetical protein [Serinicoccus sediminis]|uniref:hypothetical protein n=1 Tax=Serinicoccus sediminis TaxID=2306021 RepID=UPI00101F758F|nr:hypothetical protein [Serinicoccus sediminis]